MIITVPIPLEKAAERTVPVPAYDGLKMSLENYLHWAPPEPDGFKYEWNDGVLEADESMKLEEVKIFQNINRKFVLTDAYRQGAELVMEVECRLTKINKVRRPDICALTAEQIRNPEREESNIPAFVIEIISPFNASWEVETKMRDYFKAGVKNVWHVYPNAAEVRVYYSPKNIKVCTDDDLCEAGPAFPDFSIKASDIFV